MMAPARNPTPRRHDLGPPVVFDHECDHHVHVVLSGLTGPVHSSVGHLVANELGRPFVDSDSLVQLRSGREPHLVADTDGPEALHRLETAIADQVLSMHDAVVFAAPADVVERATASRRASTWFVWLDDATSDRSERSLQRSELADLVIDTDRLSPKEVAGRICEAWRSELRRQTARRSGPCARPLGLRGR